MRSGLTRFFAVIVTGLLLSGCTSMLLGGGGGYQPPSDSCEGDERDDERCRQ
ncbi:MAG: hypothetical protein QNI99_10670 [Woeseiaceae bacterium]|nr:hypothetical protein [Woeseiaceae bacterium]